MGKTIKIWKLSGLAGQSPEPVFLDKEPCNLDQVTRVLPAGGYTTLRTFDKFRVLRFEDHTNRLEETADLAGMPVHLDRAALSAALRLALDGFPASDARVRISLDLTQAVGTIYLVLEPLHTPSDLDYQNGVRVVTRHMHRENPKAKLTNFIATADDIRRSLPQGINEAVMIGEDDRALEGLSSNFFGVIDGVIWTAGQGVLSGITRTLVVEVAKEKGLPLRLEGVPLQDFGRLDEAFITSASRAVLPVVEIDGNIVGSGRPGPITRSVLDGYRARIERELETLV